MIEQAFLELEQSKHRRLVYYRYNEIDLAYVYYMRMNGVHTYTFIPPP